MPQSSLQREKPLRVWPDLQMWLSFTASECQALGDRYWLLYSSSTLGLLPVFNTMNNWEGGFRRFQALKYQESWLKMIYFVYLNHQ